jgi:hypothetical protein
VVGDVMRPAGEARAHQYGAMQQIVQGGAVLVDPVKPTLKAPASQRFYLHYYVELLSSFACGLTQGVLRVNRRKPASGQPRLRGRGLHSSTFLAQPKLFWSVSRMSTL